MKTLVFATNNPHKLKEVHDLAGSQFRILSLAEIGCSDDIPEFADTLEGNASLKSWHIFRKFGLDCFADDTGLEVEALQGRPGVKSARYAGDECISANNIVKVLNELEGEKNRKARFRTIISLIENDHELLFEGFVNGQILTAPRGLDGFGYDPVFQPSGYEKSFAEMPLEQKNRISHRAMAIRKLIDYLMHSGQRR